MQSVGLIYLLLVTASFLVCSCVSRQKTVRSLQAAGESFVKVLPLLAAIFGLIGLFEAFLPPQRIEAALGAASGWGALLAGGLVGAVAIGPPVAAFPLAGSLLSAGAWAPAVAAFIVAWISVGVVTLPFEAQVFGWRFALARNGLTFVVALLTGLVVGWAL